MNHYCEVCGKGLGGSLGWHALGDRRIHVNCCWVEIDRLRAELDSTEIYRIKLHELLQALHEWFMIRAPGDYKPSTLYKKVQLMLTQPAQQEE